MNEPTHRWDLDERGAGIASGELPDETPFRTHGHLVRFRIERLQTARATG
jgi:hypothetical protein